MLALVKIVRKRADREIADHMGRADEAVCDLLELGETIADIADLLDLTSSQVRAAVKRTRAAREAGGDTGGDARAVEAGTDAPVPADEAAAAAAEAGCIDRRICGVEGAVRASG